MTYPESNEEYLNPQTFKCTSCGECCRPIVIVTDEEIKTIESTGINQEDFIDIDPLDETGTVNALKQINGVCVFLKRKDDKFLCNIYEYRPSICKKYPFFYDKKLTDCRPKRWQYGMDIKKLVK